jgi:hypothetical protein
MGPLEFQGVALFKGLKGYFLTYVLSSVIWLCIKYFLMALV